MNALVTATIEGRLVDAYAADISPDGIQLVAKYAPPEGAAISIVFFLHGELVSAQGTVRWTVARMRGYHAFGVRFTEIEDDGGALVTRFCRAATA